MNQKVMVLMFVLVATTAHAAGAAVSVWSDVNEESIGATREERLIVPDDYRTLALDSGALRVLLAQAPMEPAGRDERVVLELPMPDGSVSRFAIEVSPVMEYELAARFPEISTYRGQGLDDPTASVRLDWTPKGFHAMVLSASGTVYIDPYRRGDTEHYISYSKRNFRPSDETRDFRCFVSDTEVATPHRVDSAETTAKLLSGTELRTYRAAVAATGEYTNYHGGTVAAGLAAIVVAMNRVTGIYERDVAVRMILVADNDQIIYTNPATDPYTNNNGGAMLGQNQSNLDSVIGSANYDIGHVFSTGGGGVASLRVPCVNGLKARGVTGLSSPIGDPFYVDYVAHEMGHQYGGNHTFNTSYSNCVSQRNASTAYEPGSGSTIMAYAGICGPHNIQNFSDDYFHGASLDEIINYTTLGNGNNCPVISATGNTPPTVDAGGDYTVPISTPIELIGSGDDTDGDVLTYTWEEFDLGPAGHPNSPSGNAPIFRSFDPVSEEFRILPKLSNLLNNTNTIGELLPTYSRNLTFRLTARDNRSGGGGIDSDTALLTVSDVAGPFLVTSPNTALIWNGTGPHPVTWDVANTDSPPVNCANVDIMLSVDGGLSFTETLQTATANDGASTVNLFVEDTAAARVKVRCSDNVFFDVSDTEFSVVNARPVIFLDGFESGDISEWSSSSP